MSRYSGKPATVNRPINEIYNKLSNLSTFQERIDELPEEARRKLQSAKFEGDKMTIEAPGIGEITFVIAERVEPNLIRMMAENSPVPFNIILNFKEIDPATTEISTDIDVEIPMMLRPLVGGKLQEAADKFGEMFTNFGS